MGKTNHSHISVFLMLFVWLLAVVMILSKFRNDRPILSSVFSEAAMVLAVGMIAGFFIEWIVGPGAADQAVAGNDDLYDDDAQGDDAVDASDFAALLSFSPEIFFIALLPPIIFNSGLRIGPLFFRHIQPILLFAIVGTTINAFVVGFFLFLISEFGLLGFKPTLTELMAFGSLISSTDPVSTLAVFQKFQVSPQLFYLVFGESVLNDAIAIVLFTTFAKFVGQEKSFAKLSIGVFDFIFEFLMTSVGSIVLGTLGGLCTAYVFKKIDMRHNRLVEITVYLLLVYVPFLLAEIMHLSGIVTILFTGVAAKRYVVPNLSQITTLNADMLFRLLAHLAETSIFLELGLSVFGLIGDWNWPFIGWSLLALLGARALNVYPIVQYFNRFLLRKEESLLADEVEEQPNRDWDAEMSEKRPTPSFGTVGTEMTETPFLRKDLKIRPNTANMIWFSGLKGAVSYACVRTFPNDLGHAKEFTMTTMALVIITMFFFGGTTEIALRLFKIDTGVNEAVYMRDTLREDIVPNRIRTFEYNHICPMVIRDFYMTEAMKTNDYLAEHRNIMSNNGTTNDDTFPKSDLSDDKSFATQESLFDYGAQLSNRSI